MRAVLTTWISLLITTAVLLSAAIDLAKWAQQLRNNTGQYHCRRR
ncbi:hypothetical protein [Saccharopolyspora soli]|nr:hypothetical protein [Saccharopolyspora soli]